MDNLPEKEEKPQEQPEVPQNEPVVPQQEEEKEEEQPVQPVEESKSDPVESQVNLLKKQLVLAQESCLLSLIFLEKDRNPHGESETYLYKDLRKEVAKAGQQKIKKAEEAVRLVMQK